MKKIVVSLVSMLTLLIPTQVLAENWVPVDRKLLIDADSVLVPKNAPHIRLYWEVWLENPRGHGIIILQRVANCEIRHIKTLEGIEYNGVGEAVRRLSIKDTGKYVTGDVGSRVLNIVGCDQNGTKIYRPATIFKPIPYKK